MVVTEGFIMGLVPLVTAYTSAKEQIRHGIDGLVFDARMLPVEIQEICYEKGLIPFVPAYKKEP